ncbi:MAG: putative secreted protein [Labilithrix sp.]|nr:putative secreted protein [Labilithrix sp.]
MTLVDTKGGAATLPDDLARAKLTVVVFYSEHCPCFRVHEARLLELERAYAAHGVRMLLVDSEVSATTERDARAAAERGLPAIAIDPGAKLADALAADYATYTVVLDARGRVRYRGGIDSDKDRLRDDTKTYLRDALDDLVAGREPRIAEGKALGCALQKR